MKKSIILIILTILSVVTFSQNPFNKLYGYQNRDEAQYLYKINDSIYSMTVVYTLPNDNYKSSVINVNQNLTTIDSIVFNSNDFWASGYKYNNGIYYTSGMYWVNNKNIDIFLRTFNDNGNIIIQNNYGGNDIEVGYDLIQLQDTGYIIVGRTKSYGNGGNDIYIIRTDKYGDSIWTKTYGNADNQQANFINKENDSIYVIAGEYKYSAIGNIGPFMMKINQNGDSLTSVIFDSLDNIGSFIKNNNNEYIITGRESYSHTYYPASLMKLDINLNVIWRKEYREGTQAFDVKQTSDNGYILVGYAKVASGTDDDIYVVKTDANGDTLWTKEIGGPLPDVANSVIEAPDGSGYILAGYTYSWGNGGSDAFILKLKPNGDLTTSIGLEISPKYLEAKVFPNPTSDEFNLKINNYSGELQMEIIDISGKSIYKENLNVDYNFQKSFKLKNLSSGIYNIVLKGEDFERNLKLVVE